MNGSAKTRYVSDQQGEARKSLLDGILLLRKIRILTKGVVVSPYRLQNAINTASPM